MLKVLSPWVACCTCMPRFSGSFQANGSPEDPSAYTLLGIYILIAFSCATAWPGLQTEFFLFFFGKALIDRSAMTRKSANSIPSAGMVE